MSRRYSQPRYFQGFYVVGDRGLTSFRFSLPQKRGAQARPTRPRITSKRMAGSAPTVYEESIAIAGKQIDGGSD
jgi:hypothetical protein